MVLKITIFINWLMCKRSAIVGIIKGIRYGSLLLVRLICSAWRLYNFGVGKVVLDGGPENCCLNWQSEIMLSRVSVV